MQNMSMVDECWKEWKNAPCTESLHSKKLKRGTCTFIDHHNCLSHHLGCHLNAGIEQFLLPKSLCVCFVVKFNINKGAVSFMQGMQRYSGKQCLSNSET